MGRDDDEAWQAIVDNYGEPVLDDDPTPEAPASAGPEPDPWSDSLPSERASWDDPFPDSDWTTDRFVPPPPPPLPKPSHDRMIAWAGVFGSPLILLACLLLSISIPQLIAYALVIGFVGGFGYLVFQMPREPRDPDDDGAVI